EVGPLAVSSANVSGQPPATTVTQARDQLGDSVAVYLDGGECSIGKPSTIVDLTGPGPRIVREGAITAERVGEGLGTDRAPLGGCDVCIGLPSRELLLIGVTAGLVTFVITGLVRGVAPTIGGLAYPRDRDVHIVPTPRLGGVGIFTGMLVAVYLAAQLPAL